MIRLVAILLLACVATRPAPLSNRVAVSVSPLVQVEARTAHGEYACSFFHYWPVVFGGCWWVP